MIMVLMEKARQKNSQKNKTSIEKISVSLEFVGDVAQVVERSLSMREALGSMPSFSNFF